MASAVIITPVFVDLGPEGKALGNSVVIGQKLDEARTIERRKLL
jgi:hypothetical protein